MNITEFLTEELIKFIEELRFAGYNIDTTQHIAAQDLILILAAQGELPSEWSELGLFLAPILCHSPTEQAEFKKHFNQWVNQFNQTKISVDSKPAIKTEDPKKDPSENNTEY
jgi:uncharacterized protein with von Willebrand factor type A (vWA) domain